MSTSRGAENRLRTEVLREVPMGDAFSRLRSAFRIAEAMKEEIMELYIGAVTEAEAMRREAFEECARLTGFESLDQMHEQGLTLSLEWYPRVIQVRKILSDDSSAEKKDA